MSVSDLAVSVRGLSKSYTITHNATKPTTAAEAIVNKLRNPFEKPEQETFWALKNVEFDIQKGDVIGIIGRNGAGKSTLLKILSRITEPTTGRIALYGRVGSLLEVGTGFHPELTGRENVFLNGAILGMSKREIARQFDSIVDFSGTEQFLDTPVKRYSSGMYVRLAFAVAAHLSPEILIVDEVLAVGDAEFQTKCLGKMQDVAQAGRTVIFVSHNMASMRLLCNKGLYLNKGQVLLDGDILEIIDKYLSHGDTAEACISWEKAEAPQSPEIIFKRAYITDSSNRISSTIDCRKSFSVVVEYEVLQPLRNAAIGIIMQNQESVLICGSTDTGAYPEDTRQPGSYISRCEFPGYILNSGMYSVGFGADSMSHTNQLVRTPYCLKFAIEDMDGHAGISDRLPGVLRPQLSWVVQPEMEAKNQ